ncbi:MAG: hypothetical protein U9N09_05925 [Euryarchaeota archaeon]|nr:hypothetical protein [Euryarchaeota archaeon]
MSIAPAVSITTAKKRIAIPEIMTYSSGYETARQSSRYLDFTVD